ncbi:PDR/VanB family oxidoreductase [Bradyrhizobium sp. NP1]|uniref:PDR/VanB family oxidoreductase n=1 Tax=Bradyrhizobium sp. NP1 TaxID=3049772 RepID=UPI0025A65A3E|nr:PDR/VanB family oxidoreductase [Bradyrhizobium sp. NP1]WJR80387.1 PDR/VanB family oxidoreductase [Bradyrhizobium sp. NP1]
MRRHCSRDPFIRVVAGHPLQGNTMDASSTFNARVRRLSAVADGVLAIELGHADGGLLPAWDAGAHIDLKLPNGIARQYSLCGELADRETWRIAVLREPNSRGGSAYVHDALRAGDVIPVSGPRNNFALTDANRYLFIAGGIGITPILPMLKEASRHGRPWTLVYGGRTRGSMAFLDEIAGHQDADISIVPQDEFGLIDLDRHLSVPQRGTLIYCCGPGPLIDAVEGASRCWPPASLHRERFAPKLVAEPAAGDSFEVELALSGQVLVVGEDDSLLEVLENAGYQVTNSCRAGICGTCLLKVAAGEPDHRDDLLDDEQRASNAMILPCVSRSKTKRLVLQL